MAYRAVTMIEVKEVLRQWLCGQSRKAMARWVGLDRNTIRRYLITFQEYSRHRGFFIDPTRIRAPQDKGRVERAVQSTRDDCFAGEKLKTLEEARRRAREWCTTEYGMHRHTRTQRMPLEHFTAEEKEVLLPALSGNPTQPL